MADQMAKELTDDTTVIEAPSFIVPYIYEKTPLTDKNSNDVSGKNKPASLQSPEETRIISSNFAGSTLFKLTAGLGEDLVQEFVHRDMIYKEQRRPKIDRNEANITALKENLLSIQKNTEDFHLKLKVCPECPFQTESTLTLEHHMEKIHRVLHHEMHQDLLNLKNLDFYRCNICYYQTKNPSEMMKHLQEEMTKLEGKSRKGSSPFTAPQFLFDDRLKEENMSTVSKASSYRKTSSRRKAYENIEELKIIQWIIRQNRYSEIGGIKLWKDLESCNEVPGRTYQSMKERFRRHIVPNIRNFQLEKDQVERFRMYCQGSKSESRAI